MSSLGACSRFKQNAWKKELCSNCYRPKEEHAEAPKPPMVHLPLLEPSQGILVHVKNKKKVKKKSVSFTKQESEVIGYGGADSSSDEEDEYFDWDESGKEEEREVVGEEEKALERLTKSNTDFNSVLGNLSTPGILPLGKQQKQTLQVTVQPFSMSDSRKPFVNKLLEELPLITTKTDPLPKEDKVEEVKTNEQMKQQPMPLMKTIIIENKSQKDEIRANPEGRKTQITRGNVITKNQGEQVKSKLYIQSVINSKSENKRSMTQLKEDKKTDRDINKIIINTGPNIEEKNNRNLQHNIDSKLTNGSIKDNEVTVKVLKLVGDGLAESREMAGEPDGKADSDEPETPLTPPPRSSFLHRDSTLFKDINMPKTPASSQEITKDTPIIREFIPKDVSPQKDSTPQVIGVECRLTSPIAVPSSLPPPIPTTPPPNSSPTPSPSPLLSPSPAPSSGLAPSSSPVPSSSPAPSTSPAPYSPPPTPSPPVTPFQNSFISSPPASPPARTKRPAPKPPILPDPSPRRRSSLGDDKKKTRMRQTLRKLLRFGSREEEVKTPDEEDPPRPRPQIIHPLDLNKSAVQVLPPSTDKNSPETYASTATAANYSTGRPSKPPPPPRSESLNLMERLKPLPNSENNVYANLESRCGIAPVKPQRTGSLRDSTSPGPKESSLNEKERLKHSTLQTDNDNVYECVGVSSAPECDMSLPPYYGSETESDIYYPYISFQNGDCKTKMKRKERGIVHSTLEENYSAVVVANLEALTHLLQQTITKKPEVPNEIMESELKLSLFNLEDEDTLRVGKFYFINSKLKELPITIAIGPAELDIPDIMEPLASFKCSTFPNKAIESDIRNGLVTVLRRTKIERLSVYARKLEKSAESVREGVHILLQVVKHLLASNGKVNTDNFVVFMSQNSPYAAYLPAEENGTVNIEDCLREMCKRLIGPLPLGRVLEKCSILEAESVLEVWLWGPASPLALPSLARWLDLERANFLNTLICNRNSSVDKEQLAFLVRSNPKSIAHASQIIEHNAS